MTREVKRGECPGCHNRSIPIEKGVMAPHTNPNPFLSVVCLGTGRQPVGRQQASKETTE